MQRDTRTISSRFLPLSVTRCWVERHSRVVSHHNQPAVMNERYHDLRRRYSTYSSREGLDPRAVILDRGSSSYGEAGYKCFGHVSNLDGGSALPLGKAIRQLQYQVDAAHKLYSTFYSSFNDDIAAIRFYAPENILADLWLLKIGGSGQKWIPPTERQCGDGDDFDEMERRVLRALSNATNARVFDESPISAGSTKRYNAAKRLQQKVQVANEQIRGLLSNASRSQDSCDALISELELLKGLLEAALDVDDNRIENDGGNDTICDQGETNGDAICW